MQTLNTAEQSTFALALAPFTAEEPAAVRRQAEAKAAQARQAQLSQEKVREAAAAAVESRKIDICEFIVGCRNAVKGRLKSPSTAKFPGTFASVNQARETQAGVRLS